MSDEPVIYTCTECGWSYSVVGPFDGKHGRADVAIEDPTPCNELATEEGTP